MPLNINDPHYIGAIADSFSSYGDNSVKKPDDTNNALAGNQIQISAM